MAFECEPCNRQFKSKRDVDRHNRYSPRHVETANTPLDRFFQRYTSFKYQPSLSPSESFARLCDHQKWEHGSKKYQKAWGGYQSALREEIELWFGEENDMTAWHTLCRAIQISPLPRTKEHGAKLVRRTHVNIVDLVEWGRQGSDFENPVKVFNSQKELRKYSMDNGKIFSHKILEEYSGGNVVLRHLLRHFAKPKSRS